MREPDRRPWCAPLLRIFEEAAALRQRAAGQGVTILAAPVSGNGEVVDAGQLSIAGSGPRQTFDAVRRYLTAIGRIATSASASASTSACLPACRSPRWCTRSSPPPSGQGHVDDDLGVLLQLPADDSGLEPVSENQDVSDGLAKPRT